MRGGRKKYVMLALALAAVSVMEYADTGSSCSTCTVPLPMAPEEVGLPPPVSAGGAAEIGAGMTKQLPRFVEVGADSCVPCKMMQPVLDGLREQYAGKLEIDFADVWKTPELSDKYGVRSIPTQIIYDSAGSEVFRHTGFWGKAEIDTKLKELGIIE